MCQSFGCEPASHGHVVGQHPAPGESTPRNTIVELHIGVAEQPPGEHSHEQQHSASDEPTRVQADTRETERSRPRSRKGRRAHTRSAFDPAPAPRLPGHEQPPITAPAEPEPGSQEGPPEPTDTQDTVALEHEQRDSAGQHEIDYTELLAAGQLFSAQTQTRALWLQDGARRRLLVLRGRAAGWARRHPVVVLALTLALGAWVLVGLTRAPHRATRAQAPSAPRALTGYSRHPQRTSGAHRARRQAATGHDVHMRMPRRGAPDGAHAQTPSANTSARPANKPAEEPAPAAPPSPPPPQPSAAAQSGGGPFSP